VKTLTLEVSDEMYTALSYRASITGTTAENWATNALDAATERTRDELSWRESGRGGGTTLTQSEIKQSIQNIRRKGYLAAGFFIPERDDEE
jgi:hypothetical protein